MKLEISIDGRAVTVDSNGTCSIYQITPGLYSVLQDGRSYEVWIGRDGKDWRASIGDRTFTLEIEDPRNSAKRSGAALGHMHQEVRAPMPGKVVRVLVHEGDDVLAGQGLAVVEAMKMQNELKALRAGRIVRVAVQDGDTVSSGDVLVTLE